MDLSLSYRTSPASEGQPDIVRNLAVERPSALWAISEHAPELEALPRRVREKPCQLSSCASVCACEKRSSFPRYAGR